MAENYIRAQPPKPAMAFSKKSVGIIIGGLSLFLALAINFGIKQKSAVRAQAQEGKTTLGSALMQLPNSYSELKPSKPTPAALVTVAAKQDRGELARLRERLQAERLKRASEARLASTNFKSFPKETSDDIDGKARLSSSDDNTVRDNAQSLNARDDANRQDEKRRFWEDEHLKSEILGAVLREPPSRYTLMTGTIIPGVLLTALNSDLPGQILGQVSQNVYDSLNGRHLLIPQGTKVIGHYDSRVSYGQERLLIVWNRLIFPNTSSLSLSNMPGVDLYGQAGLSDQVNNHYLKLFTGVVLSSLLGAGAQVADGPTYQTVNPDYGQLAVQGLAKNTNETGQEVTKRNLNIQPTLEIRPGYRFNIFVSKDIVLSPYELEN